MDFVLGALLDGRRLRALAVIGAFTREALAIEIDQGIKASRYARPGGGCAFGRHAGALRAALQASWSGVSD